MIKVVLADDQKIVREGIKMILSLYDEIEVIAEAENGKELINLLQDIQPDVILMDIRMPIIGGVEATKIIKQVNKNIKIIILTTFNEDEYIFKAIRNGADGYLLKDVGSEYIVRAIKSAYNGGMLLDPEVTTKVIKAFNSIVDSNEYYIQDNKLELLTTRELDVVKLISQGKNNKEISKALFITEGTVKNYVTRILSKLELKSRTELAIYANNLNLEYSNV